MKSICSFDGCLKNVFCKNLCNSHYQKQLLYGTPKGNPIISKGHIDDLGYKKISVNGENIREHILVAERALGKKLPKGSVIHHVNEIKTDNRGENLVICPNEAYHQILHRRQRALNESGNANKRQCTFCKKWDLEPEININKANSSSFHNSCRNEKRRLDYFKNKGI